MMIGLMKTEVVLKLSIFLYKCFNILFNENRGCIEITDTESTTEVAREV